MQDLKQTLMYVFLGIYILPIMTDISHSLKILTLLVFSDNSSGKSSSQTKNKNDNPVKCKARRCTTHILLILNE